MIDVNDKDIALSALSALALIEQVFGLAGIDANLSHGGLITRQLISRMGGLGETRAFKIPGVRRLLKTHGPMDSFTRKAAIELIGKRDPANPNASFDDHKRLFIEPHPHDTELTPSMEFSHLVEKNLFRIGADLRCPTCVLSSWVPLETLQQSISCSLCGAKYDATRQLVEGEFTYRRSGVLGLEKNNQGAIPVALLLQQLSTNFPSYSRGTVFGVSYDLKSSERGAEIPNCETDFFILFRKPRSEKTYVLIGECKDVGGALDETDIFNMRKVSDAFPTHRFETYIMFAKLAPFSDNKIKLAGSLNTPFRNRVIMLTQRELEPYYLFKRTNIELGLDLHAYGPEDLARATKKIYFST